MLGFLSEAGQIAFHIRFSFLEINYSALNVSISNSINYSRINALIFSLSFKRISQTWSLNFSMNTIRPSLASIGLLMFRLQIVLD